MRRLAVLAPEAGGFYIGDLLAGIDEACRGRDAQLLVVQSADSWQASIYEHPPIEEYLGLTAGVRDGVIAVTSTAGAAELAGLATAERVVAVAGPPVTDDGVAFVVDNVGGAMAAVRHLIGHGHRRIGFVGAFVQHDVSERYRGYLAALEQAGLVPDPSLCFGVHDDLTAGGEEAARAIVEAGVPVTAVFASTDTHAVSMMAALRRAGVRAPEDVAIVGFDDSELAQTAVPGLTSVRQVPWALGEAAGRGALDIIDGVGVSPGRHVLPVRLVQRHSCGCFEPHQDLLEAGEDWNAPDWQQRLAVVLVRALAAPTVADEERLHRNAIWPKVDLVIQSFDAAVRGAPVVNLTELDEAWREASDRTRNAETLMRLVDLLEFVGVCRQARGNPELLRPRLRNFLAQARLQILRYAAIADPLRHPQAPRINRSLTRFFLETAERPTLDLSWLGHIEAVAGCLALWERDGATGTPRRLRVAGAYGTGADALPKDAVIEARDFPPRAWLDGLSTGRRPLAVTLIPVVTPRHDWGVLAAALPLQHRYYDGYWGLHHGADLVALSLEACE